MTAIFCRIKISPSIDATLTPATCILSRSFVAAQAADGRAAELLVGLALTYGYLLLAHRDGWARFCADHRLPSGGLDEHLAGGDVLGAAEGDAEAKTE